MVVLNHLVVQEDTIQAGVPAILVYMELEVALVLLLQMPVAAAVVDSSAVVPAHGLVAAAAAATLILLQQGLVIPRVFSQEMELSLLHGKNIVLYNNPIK
jgi:hypothetical protein